MGRAMRLAFVLTVFASAIAAAPQPAPAVRAIPRFALEPNPIALAGPARSQRYLEASGRRAAFLGREDGSFEAWVYPLKVLHGFQLSFTTPAFSVTAANITPDRETGIGDWSDDDIKRALVDGTRPAHARLPGTPLAAVMPANFYKALLPRDLDAIVAYLRSVKPVRNQVAPPNYLQPVHRDAYPDAEAGFTEEQVLRDPVRRGAYLVTIGHCMECHSAWARGVSDFKNGFGKGGRVFSRSLVQGFPSTWEKSTAPNITSHPTAGIGAWTDSEIKRAITKGIARDGRVLNPPMAIAWYSGMTESDLDAIIAWLRTVPPLD